MIVIHGEIPYKRMDFLPTWEIKQYTKKPRNACIQYQKYYEERKEKEKSPEEIEVGNCDAQVVFNGHAFSRYHHEVFVGSFIYLWQWWSVQRMEIHLLSLSLSHSLVILSLLSLYLWVFCWRLQWPTKYCHVHNSF